MRWTAAVVLVVLGAACGPQQEAAQGRHVVSTVAPLSAILRELAGERSRCTLSLRLAPRRTPMSPASDAQAVESALALF